MSSNFNLFKSFRILLFPFSLLYGLVVITRNYLFDKNILRSASFNLPVIAVGNLSTGGTGKSPMVEYLVTLLKDRYLTATLSRGYKRKTKGYLLANSTTTASELGDEPMQFHSKFPTVTVVVGEERVTAIPQLLRDRPETKIIILDDALQHRSVRPGFSILLSEYGNLFTHDFFLPSGNLRDQRSSYKRADIIVVTKCPGDMEQPRRIKLLKEIDSVPGQKVFFTTTQYGVPYHIISKQPQAITLQDEILMVCGIANPGPLYVYLVQQAKTCYMLPFTDHHIFTPADLKKIRRKMEAIHAERKIIITTEKDAVRLLEFKDELAGMPVYVLPVQHHFLFDEGMQFDNFVTTYIERFQ